MIDLVDFHAKLAAKLLAEGSTAAVLFGRSHFIRQDNQGPGTANRVIVAPGVPDADDWGEIKVPTKAHTREQPDEAIHGELVTVEAWGYDPTAPSDEALQYRAVRALWHCVLRAVGALVREGGHDSTTWWDSGTQLLGKPVDRRHGERARVTFVIDFSVRAPTPAETTPAEPEPLAAEVEP